jgi:uncharacterized protein with HEPN domain
MQKDKASLADVVDSMRLAAAYLGQMTVQEFEGSVEKIDAVSRRLEIIGEATKRLSMSLRGAHLEVPWQTMAGMRDKLIHGYDVIRVDRIYDAVTKVIPPLIPTLEAILNTLPDPD